MMTEKEEKSDRGRSLMVKPPPPPAETAEFLQWGSRKRLRCMRIRGGGGGVGGTTTTTTATATSISPTHRLSSSPSPDPIPPSSNSSGRIRRKTTTRFPSITSAPRLTRNSEAAVTMRSEKRRISPEKEERSYTTRGSGSAVAAAAAANTEENGGVDEQLNHHHHLHQIISNGKNGGNNPVWPKLYIALSSKEKEEDFLAMKGCKLPQRPKKRAKLIQRTILLVSPGAWLPEMSLERYEVREKKTSKKQRPRGLKAMGNMDSDSE